MAELHASSFQVLHGVNQNTAQGLQNVNSTSSFLKKKRSCGYTKCSIWFPTSFSLAVANSFRLSACTQTA